MSFYRSSHKQFVLQARGEAVELKLKVLDDKLIRAQVSEEEKLKPLHDNVSTLTEKLFAERLAREARILRV